MGPLAICGENSARAPPSGGERKILAFPTPRGSLSRGKIHLQDSFSALALMAALRPIRLF